MTPKVSIVIPAYNNEQYIAETLRSVLDQDFENYEVVIADHSSNDGTAEIIESFAGHPKLRILEPTPAGGGAVANWNRVSQFATGEYIKLVCGDDLITRDALSVQVAAIEAHPSAVLVSSRRDLIDANGVPFIRNRGLQGIEGLTSGAAAIRATVRSGTNIFGEPACSLFRRDLLGKIGWWDDTNPYLIDVATLVRICRYGDMVAIRQSHASFRVSASQWSVRLANRQAGQAWAFQQALRSEDPRSVKRSDVALGHIRALALSFLRRFAYVQLKRRMGHEHAVRSTT